MADLSEAEDSSLFLRLFLPLVPAAGVLLAAAFFSAALAFAAQSWHLKGNYSMLTISAYTKIISK